MKRFSLVVTASLLAGCASAASPPPLPNADDPWTAVSALERGSNVVVVIDCFENRPPPCDLELSGVGGERSRLEGRLVEASASSVLLDVKSADGPPAPIARVDVTRIFVEEDETSHLGTLIGAAIGTGFCAFAGLYGEEDFVFSAKLMFAAICTGGGAAIGYLADRDPPTTRLIYERPAGWPGISRRSPGAG